MRAPERISLRVAMALAGLLVLVACVMAAVLWLVPTPAPPGARAADPTRVAGAARLQTAPQPDLAGYRAQKRAELDAVGPASDAPGFARIPVERAMALMTERGLRAEPDPRGPSP